MFDRMADDIIVLLAFGLGVTLFYGVAHKALAYPTPTIPLPKRTALTESNEKIILVAKLQYVFLVISIPALGFIKLSVLCFYRRIFVTDKRMRNLHNLLYIILFSIITLWAMGYCLAFMFACKGHFAAWWTSAISLITNCVNTLELLFSFAISDFVTDTIVIILPIPLIMKLHLPTKKKVGVLLMFLLGILALVASLVRMIWVIWARQVGFDPSLDQDLLNTTLLFWSMVEINVGIIAICLPTLRPLFQHKSVESVVHSVRSRLSVKSQSNDSLRSGYVKQHDVPQDAYPLVEGTNLSIPRTLSK